MINGIILKGKVGGILKKLMILLFSSLFLCSCQQKEDVFISYDEYMNIRYQLEQCDTFDKEYDFKVALIYNPINDEYRYDIIIDQPSCDMYDVTAVAYADEDDDEICPNIGIFDVYKYHIINDYIDRDHGYYKGINLSGMTSSTGSIKLYVSYYLDDDYKTKVENFIEVFESEIR